MRLAWWLTAAALLVVALPARADEAEPTKLSSRVVVDGVTHEPAAITGTRLTVLVSALTIQGQRLDLSEPNSIKTYLGSSEVKAPYSLGTFGETDGPLALVIVVQATLDYQDVLPVIAETLDTTLLAALDEKTTQIAVLPYGEAIGTGKLTPLKAARAKVTQLAHDGTAGDPALLETVERALLMLKKAKTEPEGRSLRKIILVIGDGRDRAGDRERVTRLGDRAKKDGVRIHSFAYSPTDQRRPLLLLGELSKRSLGTFRWLQRGQADSWIPKFTQLSEEIENQYVLTYFLGADEDPSGKKVKVVTVRTEATSNDLKVPDALCGGEVCAGYCASDRCVVPKAPESRGVLGWVLLIGGIGLGAVLVLGAIGYVMTHRSQRIPLPPGVLPPGMVPGVAPGSLPPGIKGKPVAAPAVMAPAGAAYLMFVDGPRAGQRLPLRHGFLIGKAPTCDLVIEDGYTSTHHAQLAMDGTGKWKLYDMGSTNGTFVNGVRVTDAALDTGISIKIGSQELRFLAQ